MPPSRACTRRGRCSRARGSGSRDAVSGAERSELAGAASVRGTGIPSGSERDRRARLLSWHFVLVVSSGLCYFTALAMLTPVLPDYIEKSLGHGSIAVGIGVG